MDRDRAKAHFVLRVGIVNIVIPRRGDLLPRVMMEIRIFMSGIASSVIRSEITGIEAAGTGSAFQMTNI